MSLIFLVQCARCHLRISRSCTMSFFELSVCNRTSALWISNHGPMTWFQMTFLGIVRSKCTLDCCLWTSSCINSFVLLIRHWREKSYERLQIFVFMSDSGMQPFLIWGISNRYHTNFLHQWELEWNKRDRSPNINSFRFQYFPQPW